MVMMATIIIVHRQKVVLQMLYSLVHVMRTKRMSKIGYLSFLLMLCLILLLFYLLLLHLQQDIVNEVVPLIYPPGGLRKSMKVYDVRRCILNSALFPLFEVHPPQCLGEGQRAPLVGIHEDSSIRPDKTKEGSYHSEMIVDRIRHCSDSAPPSSAAELFHNEVVQGKVSYHI